MSDRFGPDINEDKREIDFSKPSSEWGLSQEELDNLYDTIVDIASEKKVDEELGLGPNEELGLEHTSYYVKVDEKTGDLIAVPEVDENPTPQAEELKSSDLKEGPDGKDLVEPGVVEPGLTKSSFELHLSKFEKDFLNKDGQINEGFKWEGYGLTPLGALDILHEAGKYPELPRNITQEHAKDLLYSYYGVEISQPRERLLESMKERVTNLFNDSKGFFEDLAKLASLEMKNVGSKVKDLLSTSKGQEKAAELYNSIDFSKAIVDGKLDLNAVKTIQKEMNKAEKLARKSNLTKEAFDFSLKVKDNTINFFNKTRNAIGNTLKKTSDAIDRAYNKAGAAIDRSIDKTKAAFIAVGTKINQEIQKEKLKTANRLEEKAKKLQEKAKALKGEVDPKQAEAREKEKSAALADELKAKAPRPDFGDKKETDKKAGGPPTVGDFRPDQTPEASIEVTSSTHTRSEEGKLIRENIEKMIKMSELDLGKRDEFANSIIKDVKYLEAFVKDIAKNPNSASAKLLEDDKLSMELLNKIWNHPEATQVQLVPIAKVLLEKGHTFPIHPNIFVQTEIEKSLDNKNSKGLDLINASKKNRDAGLQREVTDSLSLLSTNMRKLLYSQMKNYKEVLGKNLPDILRQDLFNSTLSLVHSEDFTLAISFRIPPREPSKGSNSDRDIQISYRIYDKSSKQLTSIPLTVNDKVLNLYQKARETNPDLNIGDVLDETIRNNIESFAGRLKGDELDKFNDFMTQISNIIRDTSDADWCAYNINQINGSLNTLIERQEELERREGKFSDVFYQNMDPYVLTKEHGYVRVSVGGPQRRGIGDRYDSRDLEEERLLALEAAGLLNENQRNNLNDREEEPVYNPSAPEE